MTSNNSTISHISTHREKTPLAVTKRTPLSDTCPQCCGPRPVPPGRMRVTDDGTEVRCSYHCGNCGNVWAAGWNASILSPKELAAVVSQGAKLAGAR